MEEVKREAEMKKTGPRGRRISPSLFCLLSSVLFVGCSTQPPATQPSSAYDRQQQALHDPMGYSPHVDKADISGGDIGSLDKQGLKRDVDHVLNP